MHESPWRWSPVPATVCPACDSRRRSAWLAAAVLIVLLVSVACGSETGSESSNPQPEETFQKVTPSDRVFTFDDFTAMGFKKSKEYDVEGLTAATDAYFGFWRPEGQDAKEFEIRFYNSHEDAVEYGTFFAGEATGPDAKLYEDTATWDEGLKKRRYFHAGPVGTHGSGAVHPKFGGYAIFANMVLLCEGANPEHSLERCASLVAAVLAADSE